MKVLTKPGARLSAVLFYAVFSVALIFVAVSIAWQLFTTKYPTHSDVFWMGVECGALGILSLGFLAFGLFFIYRLSSAIAQAKRQSKESQR